MTSKTKIPPLEASTKETITVAPDETITLDTPEMMSKIIFNSAVLEWKNFHTSQPDYDRWIIIWCNLGSLSQNLYITHREMNGNYELPNPVKKYPAQAWAYINFPSINADEFEKLKLELGKIKKKDEVVEDNKVIHKDDGIYKEADQV